MKWGKVIASMLWVSIPSLVLAQGTAVIQYKNTISDSSTSLKTVKKVISKFKFNYGMTYLGPSLSSEYQDGATYNRTNSGQDYQGTDTDPTGSTQLYHSFELAYKFNKHIKVSFTKTFQDDLNEDIEYENYNKDGSVWSKGKRKSGISYNNERAHLTYSGIFSNNYVYFSSNFFYEFPSTEASQNSDMNYGLGIQPTLIIYSRIPGLFHGINASIERDYYKNQDYTYNCGTYTVGDQTYNTKCSQKYQTSRVSISPYIGYYSSDKTFWKAQLIFDWDQDGDEVNHIGFSNKRIGFDDKTKFNDNMDNVLDFGPTHLFTKNISAGLKLRMSLNKPELERTAILGSLNLSL